MAVLKATPVGVSKKGSDGAKVIKMGKEQCSNRDDSADNSLSCPDLCRHPSLHKRLKLYYCYLVLFRMGSTQAKRVTMLCLLFVCFLF